ncbi:hypothetical protein [Paraburkholderia sp. J8-2]|uniref:hypothetical protein n=1 Tax=Paraburkholderia sp. J8-2 TaxID=2805440 RepID=UPI002AB730A9|nr:hypothetical protein [Paraburkholderia sp. J8-2]
MSKLPVAWMKVYDPAGQYVGSCVDPAAGAALMAFYGPGAQIRNGHAKKNAIWREGFEARPAAESYDYVAATIHRRAASSSDTQCGDASAAARVEAGVEQARAFARTVLAGQRTGETLHVSITAADGKSDAGSATFEEISF